MVVVNGARIKEIRAEQDLSRAAFAKRTHNKIKPGRLGRIENTEGGAEVEEDIAESIAKALKVDVDSILLDPDAPELVTLETIGDSYMCGGKEVITLGVFSGWAGQSKSNIIKALTDLAKSKDLEANVDFFHMQAPEARGFLMQVDQSEVGEEVFDEDVGLYVLTEYAVNLVLARIADREAEATASVPREEFDKLGKRFERVVKILAHITAKNPDLCEEGFLDSMKEAEQGEDNEAVATAGEDGVFPVEVSTAPPAGSNEVQTH